MQEGCAFIDRFRGRMGAGAKRQSRSQEQDWILHALGSSAFHRVVPQPSRLHRFYCHPAHAFERRPEMQMVARTEDPQAWFMAASFWESVPGIASLEHAPRACRQTTGQPKV